MSRKKATPRRITGPAPNSDSTDRMEKWRRSRLADVAEDFANILPIYSKDGAAFCRRALGVEMGTIVPQLMTDIFLQMRNHKTRSLEYLNWLKQACEYVLDEAAPRPPVGEYVPEDELN